MGNQSIHFSHVEVEYRWLLFRSGMGGVWGVDVGGV